MAAKFSVGVGGVGVTVGVAVAARVSGGKGVLTVVRPAVGVTHWIGVVRAVVLVIVAVAVTVTLIEMLLVVGVSLMCVGVGVVGEATSLGVLVAVTVGVTVGVIVGVTVVVVVVVVVGTQLASLAPVAKVVTAAAALASEELNMISVLNPNRISSTLAIAKSVRVGLLKPLPSAFTAVSTFTIEVMVSFELVDITLILTPLGLVWPWDNRGRLSLNLWLV